MDADAVATALTRRWPEGEYLHIAEATVNPWRQGSKIDVAIIACWKSRNWEIDAVEIKVSYPDWRNEIERYYWTVEGSDRQHLSRRDAKHAAVQPVWDDKTGRYDYDADVLPITRHAKPSTGKSEEWRQIAHRFWIAAPVKLAASIEGDLPEGWGLIAVDGRGCVVKVKPTVNREPRTLEWREVVGLLRCAIDASLGVRSRAFDRGLYQGWEQAQLDLIEGVTPVALEDIHPAGPRWFPGRPLR